MKASELRALLASAGDSPLPWEVDAVGRVRCALGQHVVCDCMRSEDSALVAASVNALPVHLDRIERLEAMLRRLSVVADAQSKLLVAYRTGGHPSGATLDALIGSQGVRDEARALLAETERE